ncbi:RluA family pseudouridine synthase [Sandaracinobacteroides hominis]|uniref:RluA family pseudouridine synthase n=1 Tax=Sandaracinobacteroides hominis TaxID=2780086 RepID=UPI0018F689AF|nr:RluA family pseudouridine synthase [Sandaracinobacteroides hominis]
MSREFTIAADDDGIRVDRWFKRHMADVSFNLVSRWARTGQLRVDGARVGPGDRLAEGQVLRVPPAETVPVDGAKLAARPVKPRRELSPEEIEFAQGLVIHKSKHALVINKPPGLATQGGTKTTEHVDGLLDALQFEAESRPKLVHRLDKDTSGVLLLARSARAAAYFGKSFATRDTKKLYWAVVAGHPKLDDALIDLPIGKQPGTGGEKMHVDEEAGLVAKSRFRVIDRASDKAAFVEMQPMTGRTHQLRVHAAATGTPIVGDGKYGGTEAFLTGGVSRKMHLHARRLVLGLPDGGTLDVKADLPAHFADTLKMLGFSPEDADLPIAPDKPEGPKPKRRRMSSATSGNRRGERRSRGK